MNSSSPVLICDLNRRSLDSAAGCRVTRSVAPLRFLAYLWCKKIRHGAEAWVTLHDLSACLGTGTHPRQMKRVIDWLNASGVQPVEWETATRGRWRLRLPAESLLFDRSEAEVAAWLDFERSAPAIHGALTGQQLTGLVASLLASDSAFHDGDLEAAGLQLAGNAPPCTQPEWRGTWLLRQTSVALRQTRYDEMDRALDRIAACLREGCLHGTHIDLSVLTLAAKSHYDRGQTAEAERWLARADTAACGDRHALGRYHNLYGLCVFRRWREELRAGSASGEAMPQALEKIEQHYSLALANALGVADYQGLQAVTFNLSNAFCTPGLLGKRHALVDSWLETGLGWLSQCRFICSRFYVGMDSVWGQLLALGVVLDAGMPFERVNALAGHIFGRIGNARDAAHHTHALAKKLGNRNEIASAGALLQRFERADPLP